MILQAGPLADRTDGTTITVLSALGVVALVLVVLLVMALIRGVRSIRSAGWSSLKPRIRPRGAEQAWWSRPQVWAAGVVAVLLAAVSVLYAVVPNDHGDRSAGGLTSDEQSAINAAGTIVVNLSSFTRASFEKDFQRALAGTTGDLKTQVTSVKASTQSVLTQGKFDLSAKVEHTALVEKVPQTGKQKVEAYVVMVVIYGYRSNALNQPSPQNLIVTVQKSGGKWLASSVDAAGLQ